MDITRRPDTITKPEVEALRNAFGHFYDQEKTTNFKDLDTGISFDKVTDYVDYLNSPEIGIPKGTSAKHIGITLENWYETLSEVPKYESAMTGAPKSPVNPNVAQGVRESQEIERQIREAGIQAANKKAEQQTQEFIRQQQKRVERLRGLKIKVVPKEEVPVIELPENEKKILHDIGLAATEDPGTAQKIIEANIKKSLEKSASEVRAAIPEKIITKVAVDLVEKVSPYGEFKTIEDVPNKIPVMNPASPIAALAILNDAKLKGLITDEEERKILVEMSQNLSLALDNERAVNSTLASQILPKSVVYALYGPQQITQFEVAQDQSDDNQDGIEINIREVYDRGKEIGDLWGKIASKSITTDGVVDATSTFVSSYSPTVNIAIASEAASVARGAMTVGYGIAGLQQGLLLSSWAAQGNLLLMNPEVAGLITSGGTAQLASMSGVLSSSSFSFISTGGKLSFSVFSGTAENGAKLFAAGVKFGGKTSAIAIASTETGVKVATSGIFSKIATALGGFGGPVGIAVGAAVGWVAGKVIEKINWKKVKEWSAAIVGGLAGLIALPFIGLGAAVGVGVGAAAVSLGLGGGLGGLTLGSIGSGLFSLIGAIGSATLGAIGIPILVTLLGFPVVVALILFIINSGAYIVPPGGFGLSSGISVSGITIELKCDSLDKSLDPAAYAAELVVCALSKSGLNPLYGRMVGSSGWQKLASLLSGPAINELQSSAISNTWLQCVGFASATAGQAFNSGFAQKNACSYVNSPPGEYRYVSGTNGIKGGDFFVIGSKTCSQCGGPGAPVGSCGHIGVVISLSEGGPFINCADANEAGRGVVRAANDCFAFSQITGYLRKK